MLEILRKGYLIGIGLASLTREKIEEVVDELVKRGEVAEKDRPRIVEDLMTRMRDEQKRLSNSVKDTVQKVIGEMGMPTRQQFDELRERLEKLEKQQSSRAHKSAEPKIVPPTPDNDPTT